MKVSLNWAQWYSKAGLKSLSTEELVKLATERLGGVEGYTDLSKHYEGIVVAKIVSCEKHPNADKLSLCKIDDGGVVKDVARDENGFVQVVCGAPNVREGLTVAWISPGAIVPASYGEKELFVLEARDLRGQVSNGMLASPAELGMSDDHSGILEIDPEEFVIPAQAGIQNKELDSRLRGDDGIVGTSFKELYELDDIILDIENKMFTHRPDCFGQLGVARELAGIQHKKFESPEWYYAPRAQNEERGAENEVPTISNPQSSILSISVENADMCPRYMAVAIDNVEIKPSPIWLQSHLKRVGIRPINNVVDITNYMMMLTAQPLHAFDFDKIAKNGKADIIVRKPKKGERIRLLDGKLIQPHENATLICNPDGPIALGGVMGGADSEVDENTKRVVLECATFDMYNIRKTSMAHGLFTDAVTRFNKGQPAAQLPAVLGKALDMFKELAGAKNVSETVDSNPELEQNKSVSITPEFVSDRLGKEFSAEEITKLLTNVEFKVDIEGEELVVTAPFWRTDIEIPEDIVEEVGRLYGFNNLPMALPKRSITPVAPEPLLKLKQEVRTILSRAGANEVLTYSFVHGDLLKKVGQDPKDSYAIRNALSPDLQYYRLSILPSLLEKVHMNVKAGYDEFVLFEIGKTHSKPVNKETGIPDEYNYLDMVYASSKPKTGAAYYKMLKYVNDLLASLGVPYKLEKPPQEQIDNPEKKINNEKPFDMARSAYIRYKHVDQGGLIGLVGELEEPVKKNLKLPKYVAAASFALDGQSFEPENRELNTYRPLSRYPSSDQDITLKVDESTHFSALKECLEVVLAQSEYQWKLEVASIFQKEGENTKNITFHLTLSHYERTLTTEEVNQLVAMLVKKVGSELNAAQV